MADTPEKIEDLSFTTAADTSCPPPKGITPRPGQIICGDIDMRIDTNGTWFYHGSPITRKKLVQLFSTVVRRDEDGAYWLITPAEIARIKVDDAPFLAVEMIETNDNGVKSLKFRTNVEKWVIADPSHPIRVEVDSVTNEPRPYIQVNDDGTEARINRSVFYDLVNRAKVTDIMGKDMFVIGSAGTEFVLGTATEEE